MDEKLREELVYCGLGEKSIRHLEEQLHVTQVIKGNGDYSFVIMHSQDGEGSVLLVNAAKIAELDTETREFLVANEVLHFKFRKMQDHNHTLSSKLEKLDVVRGGSQSLICKGSKGNNL